MEATRHHLRIPAERWSLEELRRFCKRSLDGRDLDRQVYRQLVLAIDEVASNIVEHAYPEGEAKQHVELDIDVQDDRVVIEFRDVGVEFNPLKAKTCDPAKSFSAGQRRGYGIALIRRIVEELRYERTSKGENVLTMTKLLDKG